MKCNIHNIELLKAEYQGHKSEWCIQCVKKKLFNSVGYETHHPEVDRFHASNAKVKVCSAPRRSTKSFASAHEMMPYCVIPGTVSWIVGPSYEVAEKEFRVIDDKLVLGREKAGLAKPDIRFTNPRAGPPTIQWPWGAILKCRSADNLDSTLGEATNCIIYSEAARMKREVRERFVEPTTNTLDGQEIIPSTPQGAAEWMRELHEAGQSGKFYDIESFHWDVSANPIYNYKKMEQAIQYYGIDHPAVREQYFGEWVFYGGLVYPIFDEKVHIIEPFDIPKRWARYRSIDFGSRDPFACGWWAVGENQEIYLYDEYYYELGDRSTPRHAEEIKNITGSDDIVSTVCDPQSRQLIEDMCYHGVPCYGGDNSISAGRQRVLEYLTPNTSGVRPFPLQGEITERKKWPRVYVFSHCKKWRREQRQYRFKEGKQIEGEKEKTEGDDHMMDLTRYFFMTRPSPLKMINELNPNSFMAIRQKMTFDRLRSRIGL